MFVTETVRHCSTCNTLTPHSRRRFNLALFASLAFLLASGELFLASPSSVGGGFVALFIAIVIAARDRERMWRIRCDRCRGKVLHANAGTKPSRHSEVFWL